MKGLSTQLIAELNKDHDNGTFFEAIVVTRDMSVDPVVKDYFCNYTQPIGFEGNVYLVEPMAFDSSFAMDNQMELPVVKINLLSIGNVVDSYLHDPTVKIRQNEILMQILHINDQGLVSLYDQDRLFVQVITSVPKKGTASIMAGLNMRLSDRVPRQTLENNEFPGIRRDIIRAGTV